MTPFQKHKIDWSSCTRCPLHEGRSKVVLFRGTIPAPICLVGESPGASEDTIGVPFIGPAGLLFDKIVEEALEGFDLKYAVTNVVGCFPKAAKMTDDHAPSAESIKACLPRVQEFLTICKPRLVVTVGDIAKRNIGKQKYFADKTVKIIHMIHPASIIRGNPTSRPLLIQRCVVTLRNAVEELCS